MDSDFLEGKAFGGDVVCGYGTFPFAVGCGGAGGGGFERHFSMGLGRGRTMDAG